jgi:hypothetical protein
MIRNGARRWHCLVPSAPLQNHLPGTPLLLRPPPTLKSLQTQQRPKTCDFPHPPANLQVRHAQGIHNVAGEKDFSAYKSYDLFDAQLTPLGWSQVSSLLFIHKFFI